VVHPAQIYHVQVASYPPDEAATLEKLRMRIEQAPGQFLVALQLPQQTEAGDGTIVGYACGTLSNDDCLTHESMSTHDPSGTLLCIHSVVIAQPLRRRGLGSRLLGAYVRYASAMAPHAVEIRLLCKQQLVRALQSMNTFVARVLLVAQ
jgi:arylalkylamine N-acetyltransferase